MADDLILRVTRGPTKGRRLFADDGLVLGRAAAGPGAFPDDQRMAPEHALIQLDADGLVFSALPAEARLAYVTPSHQFPLGVSLSLARRLELLAWTRARRAFVIEDDYDSEFRYGGAQLPALKGLGDA